MAVWACVWALAHGAFGQDAEATDDPALDLLYSANALYNRGLPKLAADQFQEFLDQHGRHDRAGDARWGLALSLFAAGDMEQAEARLAELERDRRDPRAAPIRLYRGQALLQLERWDDAAKAFEDAARRGGEDNAIRHPALAGRAEAHFQHEAWQPAAEAAEALLAADPPAELAGRARYQAGLSRLELDEAEAARDHLDVLRDARAWPDWAPTAAYYAGEASLALDDPEGAIERFQQAAAEESPVRADALFRAGGVQIDREAWNDAVRSFEAFLDLDEDHELAPWAHLYLGQARLARDDWNRARGHWQRVLEHAEVGDLASLRLARAHLDRREHDQALSVAGEARRRFGESPRQGDLMLVEAAALAETDKVREAADRYAEAAGRLEGEAAADARRISASLLLDAEAYEPALESAQAWLRDHGDTPAAPEVRFVEAEALFRLDRAGDALPVFLAVTEAEDETLAGQARMRAAQIQFAAGEWQGVVDALGPLLEERPDEPTYHPVDYLAGISLYRLERWADAATRLEAFHGARRDAPQAPDALLYAGLAHDRAEAPDRAVERLGDVVRHHGGAPAAVTAALNAARIQRGRDQADGARQILEQALRGASEPPDQGRLRYALAQALDALDRPGDAVREFRRAGEIREFPLAFEARLQEASLRVRQREWAEAVPVLEALVGENEAADQREDALRLLGVAEARRERWDEAVRALERHRREFADSESRDQVLYEWAWAEVARDRKDEAVARYRDLIRLAPDSDLAHPARVELAELLYGKGERGDAEAVAKAVVEADPAPDPLLLARARFRLGWCEFDDGRLAEAAQSFAAVAATEGVAEDLAARASFQAGEARFRRREFGPAAEAFTKAAADSAPEAVRERALLRLGESQAQAEQWPESERTFERLLQAFPESDWVERAWLGIGWARQNRGRYDQAIEAYRRVTATGSRTETAARAQFQIGECRFAQEQHEEALKELVRVDVAYGSEQWASKALLEMGRVRQAMGEEDAAKQIWTEVRERFPDTVAAEAAGGLLR